MRRSALPAAITAVLVSAAMAIGAPVRNGKVYEETKSKSCTSVRFCRINFQPVPSGKTLTLNRVSCNFLKTVNNGNAFSLAVGQANGEGAEIARAQFLTPIKLGVGSGIEMYQSNDAVALVLQQTKKPTISMDIVAGPHPSSTTVACTIVGKLT